MMPIDAPAWLNPLLAKYKSIPNKLIPIDPNGTKPISTLLPDRRSQSKEPIAIPIENVPSSKVTTLSLPPITSLANEENEVKNRAPTNHNQDIPSKDKNTVRLVFANFKLRMVSVMGFQLITKLGAGAGDAGIKLATIRPTTANAKQVPAIISAPGRLATSTPPTIVPNKIATKVPISTKPLPPVSSDLFKCCGR